MWLLVTQEQYQILQNINNSHSDRKIIPKLSHNNNWIISNDLLNDCENIGNTWYAWKDWLFSLNPTNESPKQPPPPKKPQRPNS